MKEIVFFPAKWISIGGRDRAPIFRKSFAVSDIRKATLTVGCFGMYEGYLNGQPVSDELYGTLNTDFHKRGVMDYCGEPFAEELAHRLYGRTIDVTELLRDGENVLSFLVGPGWYEAKDDTSFGHVKLCFRLAVTHGDGRETLVVSDEGTRCRPGFLTDYFILHGETQDMTRYPEGFMCADYDDGDWQAACAEEAPETRYLETDCPGDRVIRRLTPQLIFSSSEKRVYDVGEIVTGYPIVVSEAGKTGEIRLRFGELATESGELAESNIWEQHETYITDGIRRELRPRFTWFCFRYFEVVGDCEVADCAVVHSDVPIVSSFRTDDEILNWYYDSFLRTQLANMHGGIPSDCPHVERRGYTGDGQVVANAAMYYLDAQPFYKKWIYDISDCQDRVSGHVQYTAPFLPSGGGPGGWGCAIVHVPYEYYRHYRDESVLRELYPQMLRYFDYLEAHSEDDLVVSDRKNAWCLGDWCAPAQNRFNLLNAMRIPAPFVNTYFYIRSMRETLKIARILRITADEDMLRRRIKEKEEAMRRHYFDAESGDFCQNEQGANAFAVDLGLGDERTLSRMAEHYRTTGQYDTGIFGTDIVTRVLFEHGYADIAISLLTSQKEVSFAHMRDMGATTLFEYWNGVRSHCHPMFGGAAAYLAEYVLGIRLSCDIADACILIAPAAMAEVPHAEGTVLTPAGRITISYDETEAHLTLPRGAKTDIRIPDRKLTIRYTE